MNISKIRGGERLSAVQAIYQDANAQMSAMREKFKLWDEQYRGSHQLDALPGGDVPEDARSVYNITFELIEGSIETEQPAPKVTPEMSCPHHVRNAKRIENMLLHLRDKLPFEQNLDLEERIVKIFSCSGRNTEWDNGINTHSTCGDVKITCVQPAAIIPQPGVHDIQSSDYVFVNYLITKDALKLRYGLTDDEADETRLDNDVTAGDYADNAPIGDDVVTMTIMWYRNDKGDVCKFAYSGDRVLEDDEDFYARKCDYCRTCGRRRELCERDPCRAPDYYTERMDYDELEEDVICSDGRIIPALSPVIENGVPVLEEVSVPVYDDTSGLPASEEIEGISVPAVVKVLVPKMKKTRLPYFKPRKFPIDIRYNIKDFDSFWGISDCEIIREEQQSINKIQSLIDEAAMSSGAVLFKPEETVLEYSNKKLFDVINLRDNQDQRQFGMFQYQVNIAQWMDTLNALREQAKRKLGISDSYLGQYDSSAKSGYAKNLQINQAAGRLASKRVNKYAFSAECDRSIFELMLAFSDEPRAISHGDSECDIALGERFNRYDFYEYDAKTGEWFIDDNYTFSCDLDGGVEQQRSVMWGIIKEDFSAGMYGDPNMPETKLLAWTHLERMHYPNARVIVKRLKEQMQQQMQQQAEQAVSDVTVDPDAAQGGEVRLKDSGQALNDQAERMLGGK